MVETLNLRIRTRKGMHKLQSLTSISTIHELKKAISELCGIPYSLLKVLYNYPPKEIEGDGDLNSLSMKDGELLTVEEADISSIPNKIATNEVIIPPKAISKLPENTRREVVNPPEAVSNSLAELCGGELKRQIVPANNSCLFTSVNFVMENGILDIDCQRSMRELIAQTVKNDEESFSEAILGKENSAYCDWIRESASWGGSIEIIILSKYYKTEICVVDIRTSRIDRFGEDCKYPSRVFIIYDGIHFDPLYLLPFNSSKVQVKFSTQDDFVMAQALEMAIQAQKAKQFTDVNSFKLKCLVCQKGLSGQLEAQEHAEKTGHINFGETS